jgi:hypothetical protein
VREALSFSRKVAFHPLLKKTMAFMLPCYFGKIKVHLPQHNDEKRTAPLVVLKKTLDLATIAGHVARFMVRSVPRFSLSSFDC